MRLFHSRGYRVGLVARNINKISHLSDEINASLFQFDVSKPDFVHKLFKDVDKDLGNLDLVIFNPSKRFSGRIEELNANQVIDNRVNQSDRYLHAFKDLMSYLGSEFKYPSVEGFDVSHHGGKDAVASAVNFSVQGPEKSKYRLFNIPLTLSGNDVGSLQHILERRINQADVNPLPDIVLIDGGKLQLDAALTIFSKKLKKPPIILSIVKGSKRVRATETILSKNGILEMPKDSPGFILLQQIRDESHRFAIMNNRKKKNKTIRLSSLDKINGLGPKRKKNICLAI